MAPTKKPATKKPAAKKTSTTACAKRPLTAYQKFVKKEFHNVGTAKSTAQDKIKLVAKLWAKQK
jgi:hypothetical protein